MKGKILDYNIQESKGIISGDDGQRYSFENKDWKASELPKVNQVVDFEIDELNAKNIYAQTVQQSNSNSADGKNITFPLISLVSSIVGIFFGLLAIVGIIFGHLAKSNIRKNPEEFGGSGFATAGLVIGYICVIIWLITMLFLGGTFFALLLNS